MSCHTHYCRDEICEHVLTYEISCSISQLLGVKGNRRKERKGWEGKYNNGSKINTAHTLFCCLNWCVFFSTVLVYRNTYCMWIYVAWKLRLDFCRFLLPNTLLKWHSVKTKTLSWRNRHIRIIWTKENTSLLSSTGKRTLDTHIYTCRTIEHIQLVYTHCLWWPRLLPGRTPVVLSNFKATKWMDLNPPLVVNTHTVAM